MERRKNRSPRRKRKAPLIAENDRPGSADVNIAPLENKSVSMRLVPMQLRREFKVMRTSAPSTTETGSNVSWAGVPTADELKSFGVHDRVEALTTDFRDWSLSNLSSWRKPLEKNHVKRQQSKLRRMFLKRTSPRSQRAKGRGAHEKIAVPASKAMCDGPGYSTHARMHVKDDTQERAREKS